MYVSKMFDVVEMAACSKCGMPIGRRCQDKRGNVLMPSQSHSARRKEYSRLQSEAAKINADHAKETERISQAHKDMLAAKKRDERIGVVLFGIRLARKIGLSQDDLDRRLAEMLVDSGAYDHFTGGEHDLWDKTLETAKVTFESH